MNTESMTNQSGFTEAYKTFRSGRVTTEPSWWISRRDKAIEVFSELGFPTTKSEAWKYTNLKPFAAAEFSLLTEPQPVDESTVRPHKFSVDGWTECVFIDGVYSAEHSNVTSTDGLDVLSLMDAISEKASSLKEHFESFWAENNGWENHPFVALNTAFTQGGTVIRARKGCTIEKPIHLLFITNNKSCATAAHPRVVIFAEESSSLSVIESHATTGDSASFTNVVTEVAVSQNACVHHYRCQSESTSTFFFSNLAVHMDRDSRFSTHTASFGAKLARHEITAILDAPGVECTMNGVYLVSGEQQIDNRTMIDHAKPHGESHENYKGVLSGQAKGSFNGKILVRPDAQKTDAKQSSQGLLLSDGSEINSKPELEIYADDVKCTHGATTGALSDESLFYLRGRGIPMETARTMLIHAFLNDIVAHIPIEPLRSRLEHTLTDRLRASGSKK